MGHMENEPTGTQYGVAAVHTQPTNCKSQSQFQLIIHDTNKQKPKVAATTEIKNMGPNLAVGFYLYK